MTLISTGYMSRHGCRVVAHGTFFSIEDARVHPPVLLYSGNTLSNNLQLASPEYLLSTLCLQPLISLLSSVHELILLN
jgi:hypothetical protein